MSVHTTVAMPPLPGVGPNGTQNEHDEAGQPDPASSRSSGREEGFIEHKHHQIKAKGGSDAAREQKERGSCLVRLDPDAVAEKAIDAGQFESIIEGQQDANDGRITKQIADDHLHVAELLVAHPSWDRQEGDATQACAHHTEGYRPPWTAPSTDRKVGH